MARLNNHHDTSQILNASDCWIDKCLLADGSIFDSEKSLWTPSVISEVYKSFVEHPDFGGDSFMTKLKRQMGNASPSAKQLVSEMLWILLLFPSNISAQTKRQQIVEMWELSGEQLPLSHSLLTDQVLTGIGSGGPAFNNYRPDELEFLIALAADIKTRPAEVRSVVRDYEKFLSWISAVPMRGNRQFRHMLRYFSFPDQVERISSNNDRMSILEGFGVAARRVVGDWSDRQLDEGLLALREMLQRDNPLAVIDFYDSPWKERWSGDRKIKTPDGEVSVAIPLDDEREEVVPPVRQIEGRESLQIQAKLARIGSVMGFKIWIARADQARVSELLAPNEQIAFVEDLPLSYDGITLDTIKLIDVIWLKGRSIARAFEVEHTTAVYSGLLRMADLLALQPNMDIRLHIVAPDERLTCPRFLIH